MLGGYHPCKQQGDTVASETMHAIRMHEFGGPNVLIDEVIPRPTPGPDEVLVRVRAAAVNPYDWKLRKGAFPSGITFPMTPGSEIAGTIASGPRSGQDVFSSLGRMGAYAEYVVAKLSVLADKPRSLDYVQAASVPVGSLTAWQALFDHGRLQPGQTVLIHAAAGVVGLFAVQLAKWKGATVIGTASASNADFVRSLGADVVVAYDRERFEDRARDVDLVIDPIGGDTQQRSFTTIKPGGALIALTSPPPQRPGIRTEMMSSTASGELLSRIGTLVENGTLRTFVAEVLPLAEAGRAQDDGERGHHSPGKIVLRVD
jgi:NADPH:quinone reductase-like Zn-dependent oxidoreductase